jgi:dipeptidyl aminopeptidase/acylaminoacyl peptidase
MKAFVIAAALLICAPAAALSHAFTVEAMQQLSRISDVNVSPDGRWVAFDVATSDVKKNAIVHNIWLVRSDGSGMRAFTTLKKGSATQPRWGADSHQLYYTTADKKKHSQIFRRAVDGVKAVQITTAGVDIDSFWLAPHGNAIVFTAAVYPQCRSLTCDEQTAKSRDDDPVQVRVITGLPFRRWDTWRDDLREHVFAMPATGGVAKDLTPGDVDTPAGAGNDLDISPDGREIVFDRNTRNESIDGTSNLFVLPIDGGMPKQITSTEGGVAAPQYSPDGKYIAYQATVRYAQSDTPRLYLYDRAARTSHQLLATKDVPIGPCLWSRDSKYLWCNTGVGGTVPVVRVDIGADTSATVRITGSNPEVQVAPNAVFFAHEDFSHPADIYRLAGFDPINPPVQITSINAAKLRNIDFGQSSSFTYPGWHGDTVQAFEIKPPGFTPAKKYPLLLLMHGGPEGAWTDEFHYRWNAQLFAAAGYVVIMPNFHGSTGFGTPFMDAIQGQWGGAPYEDQMKAVDLAMTWPYVDATRLSAAGASYGGYMANWVEGHTSRFRSIVSHDGLFDTLTALYASDFVGGTQSEFHGTAWNDPDALVRQSPGYYARNFRTPMLVIHGLRDYRVELGSGLAMFQVLQAMHVPSKLIIFNTENHWVLKPADSIFWYHSVLGWLNYWSAPDQAKYQAMLKGEAVARP